MGAAAAPVPPHVRGGTGPTTVVTLPLPFAALRLDMADPGDVTRVIGACLLLTLLGQGLSHLLSRHAWPASLRRAYQSLGRAKRDEWNTRVWSSVHAVLVSGCVGCGLVWCVVWDGWRSGMHAYTHAHHRTMASHSTTPLPLPLTTYLQALAARAVGRGARHPRGHAAPLRRGALGHRHHHRLPARGRAAGGLLHAPAPTAAALAPVGVRPHLGTGLHARAPPRRSVQCV